MTSSEKNIIFAYILALFLGGVGLLYLGRDEDKTIGIILTIITIIAWFPFFLGVIPGIAGLYLTYKAAQELGLA